MEPTTIVRQAHRTASRVIEGKAVVIVIDRKKLHTLNTVGTRIWELAEGGCPLSEIAEALEREFDVDRETALSDATAFVGQLTAAGALELK